MPTPPATRPPLVHRLGDYAQLMRLDKPIGSLLLLWPTLWGLWLAGRGQPDREVVVIFVLGVLLMRSAGCVINDFADRRFDPHVERTRERPLAAGRVSPGEALGLFVALSLLAFGLVLFLNPLTIALSVPGIVFTASYPFMKRFHSLPQVHLGAAFGWGVPMAFAALTNSLPPAAWWLFATNVVWSVIYDTEYAMVDRDDDLRIGVKSSAILFGARDRVIIARLQALMLLMLVVQGVLSDLGWPYYLAVLVGVWIFVYQQFLIRHRERAGCFQAFLNNNWFGLTIFLGMLLGLLP